MNKTLVTVVKSSILAAGMTLATAGFSFVNAASITFDANDAQGSDAVSVGVKAEDVTGGIKFTLTVNDAVNTGDILAAYVDFVDPSVFSDLDVEDAFSNNWEFNPGNVNNIVGGNIGQKFDLGVQLSDTGSSGGLLTSTMFTVKATGLDVSDLFNQDFAVRLQTVGPIPNGGGGSAKQFGTAPNQAVPEPLTLLGASAAVGFGAAFKRKLAQK